MKSSGLSKFALAVSVMIINLAVAILVFLVAMPLVIPAGAMPPHEYAAIQRGGATIFFVAGTILSLALVFAARCAARRGASLQETLDAIRQPCFILDEKNAYSMINSEAERILAISRERDVGKSVGTAIQTALAAASSGEFAGTAKHGLNRESIVTFGGIRYMALDNPFSPRGSATTGDAGRFVVLRNIDAELRIRDCFKDIVSAMSVLNDDTRNIVDSTSRLAKGALAQDNSIATITSSLDEFSKKIQGNTESAAKGTQFAAQAREVAERSGGEIAHALSAMNEVQDVGIRIARIVKLIDDIAFQTNLLALNASVEAARAGRQGKGFAVVAEEVRNLAGRSARAAKDTASMVEDVTERIGNASSYMSRLEEMLRNIVQEAVRMADYSASAAATSTEQATAILQVNQDLGHVNSITRTTCTAADETSAHVGNLEKKVGDLRRRLERFAMDMDASRATGEYAARNAAKAANAIPMNSPTPFGAAPVDDDFVVPFKKAAAGWDLHAEAERNSSPIPDLLRSDGYDKAYDSFLRTTAEVGETLTQAATSRLTSGPAEYKTNRDGDKIVRPEQKIHLDDAEFGRY